MRAIIMDKLAYVMKNYNFKKYDLINLMIVDIDLKLFKNVIHLIFLSVIK